MQKLFGTDGIRGLAGEFPLDRDTIIMIGGSLSRLLTEKLGRPPRFVTGRDTRESGTWIETAFTVGAIGGGATVESAAVLTTPGVAFVTGQFKFDAGIVVSASHNPFEDNGIKVFLPDGRKLDDRIEGLVETDIRNGKKTAINEEVEPKTQRAEMFRVAYMDNLANGFNDLSLAGFNIVADCANGAVSQLAGPLLRRFGAKVETINDSPNGRNINKDCGSLHLNGLREKVIEAQADFGVAYDGDADRALFVDENGNVVDGDATMWILARRLQDEGLLTNSKVVATVMSNIGLEIALRTRNIELVRTAVGDKYVLDELLKTGSAIGGEQSGHIIFPFKSIVGDGMMTTLFSLDAIAASKQTLSEAVAGLARYPQILVNVRVKEKRPLSKVGAIAKAAAEIESELDGNGRLLLRYSGTENLARVMIEGQDQSEIESQANRLADVIRSELG